MGNQRDIDGISIPPADAGFILESGAGKEVGPAFMERDRQNQIAFVKRFLNAVAMVSIKIQINYTSSTL